jgi:hypothetical protein
MDDSPLGPIQRSLSIPEIVNLICGEIDITSNHWQTLPRLARTCHFFYKPALDHLWKSITGIHILVKCMPRGLWNEEVLPNGDRSLVRTYTFHLH